MESRKKDAGVRGSGSDMARARLDIAAWALFALLFGTVGFSAYWFAPARPANGQNYAGVMLPPAGEVSGPTGSIGRTEAVVKDGETVSIGLLPSPLGTGGAESIRLLESRLETLQREVVSLRRRVLQMTELNDGYSNRLASLETGTSGGLITGSIENNVPAPAQPRLADIAAGTSERSGTLHDAGDLPKLDPEEAKSPKTAVSLPKPDPRKTRQAAVETLPAPETLADPGSAAAKPLAASDISAIMSPAGAVAESPGSSYEGRTAALSSPAEPVRPVRIVSLPASSTPPPATTAAIPPEPAPEDAQTPPEDDGSALMIRPVDPAGRTIGSADRIGRSDFAIEIGRYASRSAASDSWETFASAHTDKMSGLRALTQPAGDDPESVRLLAGPFANAAAASVACLRLELEQKACAPTLFSGEPLPESFR
ncbi:hypothetical protein V6L75_00755 [Pannonibacter sp. Pt1]